MLTCKMKGMWFIDPIDEVPLGFKRVATDRPEDFDLGFSTMADIQRRACLADMAGKRVVLVRTRRSRYNDEVYDLYEEV